MKVFFLNPEQYLSWEDEPSNYELRLPILHCGLVTEHRDFIFQRILRAEGRHRMNIQFLHEVLEFQPDIVIYSTTWPDESIDEFALQEVMARGIPVYTHVWDTYVKRPPHEMSFFNNCTYFGIADSVTNYLAYKKLCLDHPNVKDVIFTAGNIVYTDLIKPLDRSKTFDVTILGSNEGYRAQLLLELRALLEPAGINVNKSGGLVDSSKGGWTKNLSDNWIGWEEYAEIINSSKICLCSQTVKERSQLKGKVLHYIACGVPCFSDWNTEVACVVPDDCIVYYTTPEECAEKIRYYLSHPAESAALAHRALTWFNSTFDYKTFWTRFLTKVVHDQGEIPEAPLRDTFKVLAEHT